MPISLEIVRGDDPSMFPLHCGLPLLLVGPPTLLARRTLPASYLLGQGFRYLSSSDHVSYFVHFVSFVVFYGPWR